MVSLVNNTKRMHIFFNYGSQENGTSRFKPVCSVQSLDKSIASRTTQPETSSSQADEYPSLCQVVKKEEDKMERNKCLHETDKSAHARADKFTANWSTQHDTLNIFGTTITP